MVHKMGAGQDVKNEFQDSYYDTWNIELYDCPNFHPRCIQLATLLISIDASLDFMGRNGNTNKLCRISVSKDRAHDIDCPRQITI